MSIGTVFIYVTLLVLASPILWLVWWLVSDIAHPYPAPAYRHADVPHSNHPGAA